MFALFLLAIVLAALVEDTPWYNSTTSSPQNPFAGELELVELVY